ncbi:MAG: type IV pilus biogenesis/stability protein PilW, partial [Luminiphilus sp.]
MKSCLRGMVVAGVLLALLSGCVTETVGGKEPEVDPDAALERRVALARQYIGRGDWENAKRNLELAQEIDP